MIPDPNNPLSASLTSWPRLVLRVLSSLHLSPCRLFHVLRHQALRITYLMLILIAFILTLLHWPLDATHYLTPDPSGEILDRAGRPLYSFLNSRQQWCFEEPLANISPLLAQATIAAEDRRFRNHPGVDPLAALRAAWQLLTHRRVRSGASTLTMQVVKLAGHPSRSLPGKLAQTINALRLEHHASKDEILAAYLSRAPYGRNLVGCEAAARRYFGKPARELTLAEAALLAALPKAPSRLMPLKPGGAARALKRRNYVLQRMREEGFISEAERTRAAAAPLGAAWHPFPTLAPHLAHRLAPLAKRATRLATTLDRDTQAMCEELLRTHLLKFKGQIRNGALLVMDTASGAVLAYVGSGDFRAKASGSQVDAVRARRSPGSTLKPFIYALALERNDLYPSEVLLDGSFDLGRYNPKNFDKRYHGLIAADAALRRSLNVPAVMTLRRIGQPTLYDFLKRSGLTTLGRPAWSYGLGLAIGDCEARLDQLCAAYAMLARQGEYRPLTLLRGATATPPHSLLSRGTALGIYTMMEQPLPGELDAAAMGTTSLASRVCWKTGTSTGNHDAWGFVFNGQYVVGVWMGNPDGRSSRRLVGAEAALPLASQVFRRLPPNPAPAWPDPGDELRSVKVCSVSGLPSSTWCEHTRSALIPRRQFLSRICDVHWPAPARRLADSGGITDPAPSATIERWPGSARGWDLARVGAPPITDGAQATARTSTVHALQILNPPGGARFILTGERNGDRIPLRASGDEQGPVHWYLNGRFLATARPRQPLLLDLTPGNHKLVCMTPQGTTAQVRFQVARPAASNPDFERRP